MEVTRTSLRAQRNQAPKQVRQGGQTQQKGGYGEELRAQLANIGDVKREAPVITAQRVEAVVSPTEQYTRDAVKTAMEKLKKFITSQGLGGDDDIAQTTPTTPTSGGGGGKKPDFFSGLTNDEIGLMSTQQLVDRDNKMYGDTFPDGAIGIGSKSTDDFSQNPEYQSTAGDFAREQEKEKYSKLMSSLPSDYKETEAKAFLDAAAYRALVDSGLDKTVSGESSQANVGSGRLGSFGLGTHGEGAPSGDALKPGSFGISTIKRDDQAERMGGQGGLALGTTTQRQGDTVKNGIKVAKKESPAVNASSFQQKNVRGVGVSGTGKNESARPAQVKQTVASLPSNYKKTEAEAFKKAKSYKDSKAKGDAAAKATGTPTKPKAGSFGISAEGKKQAEANKEAKRKEAKKKATKQKSKSSSTSKSKSSSKKSSSKKSNTGSKKSSRGAKSSGGKKGGTSKGGSKGTSGSKKSSRGAKGGSSSRSKGGTSKGTSRRGNTRRSRRRCDIRCKFDISVLTNQNLIRDDLADVAYFVKDLQEIN